MIKVIIQSILILIIFNSSSYAYLGPGIGGGVLAATIGLIIALCAAIFGLIWFPIKIMIKKRKLKKKKEKNN